MKTAKWKLEVTVQFVKLCWKEDRSYSKSVFISWYGSLLSLNPLVSFHAAGFSLYTGIKATQNINAVSLVILLDLQARLFERERNQCEIFFTQEMTRLCQSVLFFCLSFSTSFLQQRRQPTTLFQALQCCSSFFFFFMMISNLSHPKFMSVFSLFSWLSFQALDFKYFLVLTLLLSSLPPGLVFFSLLYPSSFN